MPDVPNTGSGVNCKAGSVVLNKELWHTESISCFEQGLVIHYGELLKVWTKKNVAKWIQKYITCYELELKKAVIKQPHMKTSDCVRACLNCS